MLTTMAALAPICVLTPHLPHPAVTLVIFLICLVFSLAYQRFVMRRDLEGALT